MLHLLTGAFASGKTTILLNYARECSARKQRLWWVGLPSQRNAVYQRATAAGGIIGLEFLSSQQLYYRLLARALQHQNLLIGTGRIAMVGEALQALHSDLPSPGEARLFTRAIAEAKRYGLFPADIDPGDDPELRRLQQLYQHYENIKRARQRWDYDDFRWHSLELARQGRLQPEVPIIIVDGFRELSPLECELYYALSNVCELWLSLPEKPLLPLPPGTQQQQLPPRPAAKQLAYRASNPVSEARWVLRALKRDLAQGIHPLELAVVVPEGQVHALLSLADEYSLPLMDETPKALSDTPAGRVLLDVLELPDYPTASRLLVIPELGKLANAALRRGLSGHDALQALALELGMENILQAWLTRLEVPESGQELPWARGLLALLPDILGDIPADWQQLQQQMEARAKEASSLARGKAFRAWWAGLLQESWQLNRPKGGVALLTATLVSGRRFRRLYVMQANEGNYSLGEKEDYFWPEERRYPLKQAFRKHLLPKRFLGRNRLLFAELLSRAPEVIVSYPEGDQQGPRLRQPELTGADPAPLPLLPAGSYIELPRYQDHPLRYGQHALGTVSVQQLQRYQQCPFRYWATQQLAKPEADPWQALLHSLRTYKQLNPARLELLQQEYPQAAAWLETQSPLLYSLRFGQAFPKDAQPYALLDAVRRKGDSLHLYHFSPPGSLEADDVEAARDLLYQQWTLLWASGYVLEHYQTDIHRVYLYIWPLLGEPVSVYPNGVNKLWKSIRNRQQHAAQSFTDFQRGEVRPRPGFHCRNCPVFDVCREGQAG